MWLIHLCIPLLIVALILVNNEASFPLHGGEFDLTYKKGGHFLVSELSSSWHCCPLGIPDALLDCYADNAVDTTFQSKVYSRCICWLVPVLWRTHVVCKDNHRSSPCWPLAVWVFFMLCAWEVRYSVYRPGMHSYLHWQFIQGIKFNRLGNFFNVLICLCNTLLSLVIREGGILRHIHTFILCPLVHRWPCPGVISTCRLTMSFCFGTYHTSPRV